MAECLPSRQSCPASTHAVCCKERRLDSRGASEREKDPDDGRRRLEENEIVILDNLHRDSLTGTDLAQHANLRFVQGDVLDLPLLRELAARSTHVIHMAA